MMLKTMHFKAFCFFCGEQYSTELVRCHFGIAKAVSKHQQQYQLTKCRVDSIDWKVVAKSCLQIRLLELYNPGRRAIFILSRIDSSDHRDLLW